MVNTMRVGAFMLMALILVNEVFTSTYNINPEMDTSEEELTELAPFVANQEYIRHIHSMINAYKADMMNGRMVIETNALIDTKYKTWKRNADLINSILALPKGMNDAGR